MKQILYLSIVVVLFFSSCGVPYKQVPYFKDLKDSGNLSQKIDNYNPLKIQKDDILAITVSSLNPEASAIFNLGNTTSVNPNSTVSSAPINPISTANGFLVDQNGNIQLPLIGSVKVLGMTTAAARELIQNKLITYLKEPVVSLRLVNFKVSILGDVAKPGVFPVQTERISVTEALSLSGDLNITAIRKNVLLIRETDGKREFIRLDLNSKDIFNSPYYYLNNNDVLYVQPSNAKYASVDSNYRNAGILVSVLSILALLITRL